MPHPGKARTALKRGSLVAAANWQVVAIQSAADTTFKLLLAVPVVGGGILVTTLLGQDFSDLLAGDLRHMLFGVAGTLAARPVALAAYLSGFGLVLAGGAGLMFLVKGGTVGVLALADRSAGPVERPPLRIAGFRRAMVFSIEAFTAAAARLFRRYLVLGMTLTVVYAVVAALCVSIGYGLYALGGDRPLLLGSIVALSVSVFVALITIVNVLYLLAQITVAVNDSGVRAGVGEVSRFVRAEFWKLSRVFGVTVLLLLILTMLSVVATWGFYLIAYVPLAGLIVLPLQLGAWLLRNLVFQYLGLTALAAYLSLYRSRADGGAGGAVVVSFPMGDVMMDYEHFFSRVALRSQGSAIRKMGVMAVRVPDMISFAPGYPDPEVYAWEDFREIATELLSGRDGSVLQYGPTRGHKPLIGACLEILASRGIAASAEQLLITTGSQQGIDLVGKVLLDPGDVVLVELPAYTGAISAFRGTGAALVGVRQEPSGIALEDLERVVANERAAGRTVRCLYLVPNFQNPTGLLLSLEKRKQLLAWASRADLLIVEDDPYGALYFEDAATAADTRPIKADDQEGRVIYLSSFSKTLAPGFRVAWMVAPEAITSKLELVKQTQDLMTPALDQHIVYEAYRRGILTGRLPMLRQFYQEKRTVMQAELRAELGDLVTWPEPKGGFFLWATLPERCSTDEMLPRAVEQRVIYVAGSAFFVDGTGGNIMRLSFSLPSKARIVDGVRRLSRVVQEELADHRAPVEI